MRKARAALQVRSGGRSFLEHLSCISRDSPWGMFSLLLRAASILLSIYCVRGSVLAVHKIFTTAVGGELYHLHMQRL